MVIADEVANFVDNANLQAMRSGQRSVANKLMIQITTAYAKSNSIFKQELEYDRAVLSGTIDNPRLFCLLYYANEDEKWTDQAIYRANPLRLPEDIEEIKADRARCRNKPDEEVEFLTKSLNIWRETNSDKKYIDLDYWKKCRVPSIDFSGREVVVGVDLSVSTDLTSVSIMYKDEAGEIWCKSHGFLPEESLDRRRERIDYRKYAKLHYCTLCPGMTVDYRMVEDYIRSIETTYNCKIDKIVSDPYNALEMMQRLSQDFDVILLKQTYSNLSSPTKEFRKMVYDGKVHYERNELLDWCMSCATTSVGKSDDEMLNKQNKNKERIDLVATLIFCYTQLMLDNSYDALEELESILDILGG